MISIGRLPYLKDQMQVGAMEFREAVKEELDCFLFEILRPLPLNLDLDAPDFSAKEICVMTGSP